MVGQAGKGEIVERLDLPIEKLSLAQKLDLMEAIWDNLTKDDRTLESPERNSSGYFRTSSTSLQTVPIRHLL